MCVEFLLIILVITRSDPGGSVPRFLIDRGTPGGIVNDASKFLDWACGKDMEDFEDEDEAPAGGDDDDFKPQRPHRHDTDLHNYQTNGHLAGLDEEPVPRVNPEAKAQPQSESSQNTPPAVSQEASNGGLYGMVAGGIGAAGGFIANHTPQMITDRFVAHPAPHPNDNGSTNTSSTRRASNSSISTVSSTNSFTSALDHRMTSQSQAHSTLSPTTTEKATALDQTAERELQKIESKKRKLDERLAAVRDKEVSKQSEDTAKEEEAVRRAEERHAKEIKKQEEKYKKELDKLQQKKEKEEKKAEERKKKAVEKDERARLMKENEELKSKVQGLERDREILKGQVGDLQAQNTMLAARVGRMGGVGEEVLREVREEVERGRNGGGGRMRASSLKALASRPVGLVKKVDAAIGGKENGKENVKENHLPNPGFERVNQ